MALADPGVIDKKVGIALIAVDSSLHLKRRDLTPSGAIKRTPLL
jgi:hypothetical protein